MAEGNVQQIIYDLELLYDLTNHSIIVRSMESGRLILHVMSVPECPPDFNIEQNEDQYFKINNPNGFDFIPVYDNYDNNKELGYEK